MQAVVQTRAPAEAEAVAPVKISIEGVDKRYFAKRTVEALARVDMQIRAGEFVCLLGPSGCGKSTMLRMIAGLHRPSAGRISIDAAPGGAKPTAMVFQGYDVFPWKTVEANVRFGLEVAQVPAREAAERTARWLAKMGLSEFARAYPGTLSGGMLQRVSIARALAVEPDILLMDEPFAALDAQHRRIMQEELLALWQEARRTVVFVTHSIEEAILLGDRIIVMSARPGRVIADMRVPFARPRSSTIKTDPAFAALEQEIWSMLRDEVERAYKEEEGGGA
jgi:NitT/TauT family transport system ATP-binding protein